MTSHDAFRVPGEDLGWSVSALLAAIGVACATAVVSLTTEASEPISPAPIAATTAPTSATPTSPSTSSTTPPAEPSLGSTAAKPSGPPRCKPIAVTFSAGAGEAPTASERLQKLAAWMAANPTATATIDGHADASGDDQANLLLSRRRARWVANTLEVAGVRKDRMTVRAFGTYAPIEGVPEDASINRRVLLVTKGADGCPADLEEGN